jgi:hypothetical protein
MKFTLLLLFFAFIGTNHAQKAKINVDGDVVLANDIPVFLLETKGFPKSYTLYSMQNVQLATFETNFISNLERQNDGTFKDVNTYYFLVKFNDSQQSSCEMSSFANKKQFASFIFSRSWVENGALNEPVIQKFCQDSGFKFTHPKK